MRAAVLVAPRTFEIQEAQAPDPGPNQVRVRLEGCGICGSNLSPWEGRPWFNYPFAAGAPGHEGWGEIEAVGSGVTDFQLGERVAFLSSNAFAEYDVADFRAVVRLPPSLEKKPAPAEALGCAFNVIRRSAIKPGDQVAVVGIGFLGALITALAARAGAEVIAIARRSFALGLAQHYGATHLVTMDDHWRIIEEVKKLTSGRGCDCVIEAAGQQWPLDLAAELTRERGRLVVAGYHQDGPRQVNMQLWNWRGLDVINAHERETSVYVQGMQEAIDAMASGALNPSLLYTHSFPLERIAEGFAALEQRPGNFLKGLITL
ncbi:MAG TPA: zinc-binding dehydrogenase [Methylomirabilota bacterium]|nr:zinc-binding dehydrogenase [Methylomirabilota bacterium]